MYQIEWNPKAFRQLKKIRDTKTLATIKTAVYSLQSWPNCPKVKKLRNRPGYRLRVGKWRIIFEIEQILKIIEIEEVKKRNEHTY
jgi:mRNA-degrading endonuclease RelE of RelBE toxin-antitoxin system